MNSFGKAGNPQKGSVSSNNYEFDLGLGSGLSNSRPRSLNDQKLQQQQHSSPSSFASFSATQSKPASSTWSPKKPSWTHQPAPAPAARSSLDRPNSMVGDIFGKSWASAAPSVPSARLGIIEKNPNLFEDLVGSALGKTSSSNVPLKNAAPAPANPQTTAATRSSFSMGNVAGSLPKTSTTAPASTTTAHMKNTSWGSGANLGSYSTPTNSSSSSNINNNRNLGGPSMKSGASVSASSKKDPFGSLVDFGSKPAVKNVNSAETNNSNVGDDHTFGAFQNASKSGTPPFPSDAFPATINNPMGSVSNSGPRMDNFGIPTQDFSSNEPQSTGLNPLDSLFSSQSVSSSATPTPSGPAEVDDWGLGSEFGGNDAGGTTELEGLPPPPAGVTASAAKNKGQDNYKQGQYPDAIKWLSWAIVLLENAGDTAAIVEVLSCRASCYKEVGEYKKAVADCSKVLEQEGTNVSVLVQRALLYESIEKYKLGAEDLRTVLKLDPSNRVARSTIHRLNQLAG